MTVYKVKMESISRVKCKALRLQKLCMDKLEKVLKKVL